MLIRKAYKYRLKTTDALCEQLNKLSGCNRFVWNKSLAIQKDRLSRVFKADRKRLSYYDNACLLMLWKQSEEYRFLAEAHSQTLQQTCRDLDRAIRDCFDKKQPNKRFPVFKQKGMSDSFRYPQGCKVDNKRIFLPKIGWVGFFKSRSIEGAIKTVTVSRKGKHWYVAIQVECEHAIPDAPLSKKEVGIDCGVANTYTLSNGTILDGVPALEVSKWRKKLAIAQQRLARQKKQSRNWKKQKQRIQVIHEQMRHKRYDRNHWISSKLSQQFGFISVENLRINNMTRSAKGTVEQPGKNVSAKSGLNRSILDQGWGEFKRLLQYKMEWNGGYMVEVDAKYTSQKCHQCGHVAKENREKQPTFHCKKCGHINHADINASKNILAAGHAVLACESNRISDRKQELEAKRELVLLHA